MFSRISMLNVFSTDSFLTAGADVVVTVSYQISIKCLVTHLSVTKDEAFSLLKKSVQLAKQACDEVQQETGNTQTSFFI